MTEFALVSSVFSIMLLGSIEAGMSAWAKNSVISDAREGARYAMVRGATALGHIATAESVRVYIKQRTSLDSLRVTVTWQPNNSAGSAVWVHVAHDVPRRGPFIPQHTDSSTSKMMIVF